MRDPRDEWVEYFHEFNPTSQGICDVIEKVPGDQLELVWNEPEAPAWLNNLRIKDVVPLRILWEQQTSDWVMLAAWRQIPVCLKLPRYPSGQKFELRAKRIRNEVRVLTMLQPLELKSGRVASLEAHGITDEGIPWLATRFVPDLTPLNKAVAEKSFPDRLAIMLNVCSLVMELHDRSLVHGDLQSANVTIDKDGRPFILDFGESLKYRAPFLPGRRNNPSNPRGMNPNSLEMIYKAEPRCPAFDVMCLGRMLEEVFANELIQPHEHESSPDADTVTRTQTVWHWLSGRNPKVDEIHCGLTAQIERLQQLRYDCQLTHPAARPVSARELAGRLSMVPRGKLNPEYAQSGHWWRRIQKRAVWARGRLVILMLTMLVVLNGLNTKLIHDGYREQLEAFRSLTDPNLRRNRRAPWNMKEIRLICSDFGKELNSSSDERRDEILGEIVLAGRRAAVDSRFDISEYILGFMPDYDVAQEANSTVRLLTAEAFSLRARSRWIAGDKDGCRKLTDQALTLLLDVEVTDLDDPTPFFRTAAQIGWHGIRAQLSSDKTKLRESCDRLLAYVFPIAIQSTDRETKYWIASTQLFRAYAGHKLSLKACGGNYDKFQDVRKLKKDLQSLVTELELYRKDNGARWQLLIDSEVLLVETMTHTTMFLTSAGESDDAIQMGRDAVQRIAKLVKEYPQSVWLKRVAMNANWNAADAHHCKWKYTNEPFSVTDVETEISYRRTVLKHADSLLKEASVDVGAMEDFRVNAMRALIFCFVIDNEIGVQEFFDEIALRLPNFQQCFPEGLATVEDFAAFGVLRQVAPEQFPPNVSRFRTHISTFLKAQRDRWKKMPFENREPWRRKVTNELSRLKLCFQPFQVTEEWRSLVDTLKTMGEPQ